MTSPLMEARRVSQDFPVRGPGLFGASIGTIRALDNVNLKLFRGETLALVGESGCGKSTFARILAFINKPTAGEIRFRGAVTTERRIAAARKEIQMIFQDPYGALNPRMTVSNIISEPLRIHYPRKPHSDRVQTLMEAVGLAPNHGDRYPHEFSGGQRQRIGIARALALNPSLIIADEPVSALDVSVQSQVLNLLQDLQDDRRLTYLFITHDIAVVHHIADRVAVMYLGGIVEIASREAFFARPRHPYSQALLAAVPRFGRAKKRRDRALGGEVPSPLAPPSGCPFHPRCPRAQDLCTRTKPALEPAGTSDDGHRAACHFKD